LGGPHVQFGRVGPKTQPARGHYRRSHRYRHRERDEARWPAPPPRSARFVIASVHRFDATFGILTRNTNTNYLHISNHRSTAIPSAQAIGRGPLKMRRLNPDPMLLRRPADGNAPRSPADFNQSIQRRLEYDKLFSYDPGIPQ
jgi:hypothetical protein